MLRHLRGPYTGILCCCTQGRESNLDAHKQACLTADFHANARRYFTPGFYLIALHLPAPRALQLSLQLLLFAAINAATLYLFVFRPFVWPDGSTARFMW